MTGTTPSNVDTPNRLSPNHGLRTAVLITVLMALAACAGYEATNINQDAYRQRALTQIQGPRGLLDGALATAEHGAAAREFEPVPGVVVVFRMTV